MDQLEFKSTAHKSNRSILVQDNILEPELTQIYVYGHNGMELASSINKEQAIYLISWLSIKYNIPL